MRPTKLTTKLVDAFRTVLADELAAIAFTEDELVWQANQYLPIDEQISYRTYQRYKADIILKETQDIRHKAQDLNYDGAPVNEQDQQLETANTELVRQMYTTLKSALFKQKFALVKGIDAGLPNWRRYSWMLERKFPDFRLRLPKKPAEEANQTPTAEPEPKNITQKMTLKAWLESGSKKAAPLLDFTEMERIEYKWSKHSTHVSPWKQGPNFYKFNLTPEEVRSSEEEMADDEVKGFVNPYANLGYQPATCPDGIDYNDYENGWYTFFTMGTKTPRLPLRLWAYQQISPRDTPSDEEKERLWAAQEWERRHPGEQYLNDNGEPENIHVFTRKSVDPEPRDRHAQDFDTPASTNNIGSQIWGSSVGG